MSHITRFIILVERRLARLLVAALPLIALLGALWWPQAARSQTVTSTKIATDLRDALQNFAAAVSGQRQIFVITHTPELSGAFEQVIALKQQEHA